VIGCLGRSEDRPLRQALGEHLVEGARARLMSVVLEEVDDVPAGLVVARVREHGGAGARAGEGHGIDVAHGGLRPVGHQPNRYRMTLGLPKLKRVAPAQRFRRDQEPARTTAPKGADSSKNTPHRMVAPAPAKAGRTSVMIRLLRKIFFGKDPKMKAVEAGPCLAPRQTFDVPPQAYPRGRWTVFRNPFVKRGKSVEPTPPVQGELLLDLVKPVRNDLSDSDLEVVAATKAPVVPQTVIDVESPLPSPSSFIPSRSDPKPELAAADWARVRDQFTGHEKF